MAAEPQRPSYDPGEDEETANWHLLNSDGSLKRPYYSAPRSWVEYQAELEDRTRPEDAPHEIEKREPIQTDAPIDECEEDNTEDSRIPEPTEDRPDGQSGLFEASEKADEVDEDA